MFKDKFILCSFLFVMSLIAFHISPVKAESVCVVEAPYRFEASYDRQVNKAINEILACPYNTVIINVQGRGGVGNYAHPFFRAMLDSHKVIIARIVGYAGSYSADIACFSN